MDAHNRTHITGKITATSSDSQVFDGVQAVGVDHEVTIVLVSCRRLAAVASVEELRERLLLDGIDGVHVEPVCIARKDNGVCLSDELFTC